MQRPELRRRQLIIRLVIGAFMMIFILIISTLLIALLLGYRFDGDRLQQTGLIQFDSKPGGATVEVDGRALSGKTGTKTTTLPGVHEFVMWREGYETWRKSLTIESGTLTALTYPRLIPKDRTVTEVAKLESIVASRFTEDGRFAIAQQDVAKPELTLFDLRDNEVKTIQLVIPDSVFLSADKPEASHRFELGNWDAAGRYVTVRHTSEGVDQWIIVDRENPREAVNVSKLLNVKFELPIFSGTSGRVLYVLIDGDVRKIDIRAGTLSRPLVSNVQSFQLYDNNTVLYKSTVQVEGESRISVGYVREDDAEPIAFTVFDKSVRSSSVHISTGNYYNQQYLAYTSGNQLTILRGSYPNMAGDATLLPYASVSLPGETTHLTMNKTGDVVLVQTGDSFIGFDIERQTASAVGHIDGKGQSSNLDWLDTHLLWSDRDGALTSREFDGANVHVINRSIAGQDVSLSRNGTYLYSFGRIEDEIWLQRVRLVLE